MDKNRLKKLLQEIVEKKGPYSRDTFMHAQNCIESMSKKAKECLELLEE